MNAPTESTVEVTQSRRSRPTDERAKSQQVLDDALWRVAYEYQQIQPLVQIGDVCTTRQVLLGLLRATSEMLAALENPEVSCTCGQHYTQDDLAAGSAPCRQSR